MTIPADQLTTLTNVASMLGLPDNSEDGRIVMLINQVSAAIAERLGRSVLLLSNVAQPLTEFYSGRGSNWLPLRHRPVFTPVLAGNTTQGSAVVTGLSSTSFLFVGQPVAGAALPAAPSGVANVSIQSIDSSSQVTLTQAAALSGTAAPLYFGLNVWEDDNGYWGQSPQSFQTTSQLTWGSDYTIRADQPDGTSRSGMLLRQNNVWNTQFKRGGDMLSEMAATGVGNIRVQYAAGWASVPPDLEMAAIRIISKIRATRLYGQMLSSENFENYSYATSPFRSQIDFGLIGGDAGPVIARYAGSQLGE